MLTIDNLLKSFKPLTLNLYLLQPTSPGFGGPVEIQWGSAADRRGQVPAPRARQRGAPVARDAALSTQAAGRCVGHRHHRTLDILGSVKGGSTTCKVVPQLVS